MLEGGRAQPPLTTQMHSKVSYIQVPLLTSGAIHLKGIVHLCTSYSNECLPDAEIDFWRVRNANFVSLYEQLNMPTVKKCVSVLEADSADQNLLTSFKAQFNELKKVGGTLFYMGNLIGRMASPVCCKQFATHLCIRYMSFDRRDHCNVSSH